MEEGRAFLATPIYPVRMCGRACRRSLPITTAPVAGSIQQAALEHPLVQRAKEIFNAEVRSVVDLRNK